MLVLSRKKNESIVINNDITITVVEVREDRVRLAIVCPRDVPVHRQEVYDAIHGDSIESPFVVYQPETERREPAKAPQFVEISLGQLISEVGARPTSVRRTKRFNSEGGISG
jgi:carbon storage regulator